MELLTKKPQELMKSIKLTAILVICLLITVGAKSSNAPSSPLDTIDIKEQFNHVIKKSNRYNNYRVIKSTELLLLKSNVFDSIDGLKNKNKQTRSLLLTEETKVDSLNTLLTANRKELSKTKEVQNNISLLGLNLKKTVYNSIMWSVSVTLFMLLFMFALLFKRSNVITRKKVKESEELKEEIEQNRRKSREREEKIVRKLHDEINRYKKKVYQLEKNLHS